MSNYNNQHQNPQSYLPEEHLLRYDLLLHATTNDVPASQTIPSGRLSHTLGFPYQEELLQDYLHNDAETFPGYPDPMDQSAQYNPYASQIIPEYMPRQTSPLPFPDYDSLLLPRPSDFASQFLQPSPPIPRRRRVSSTTSMASATSSIYSASEEASRSTSPSAAEMANWGYRNDKGSWSCAFPGCTSKTVFHRGCDLRKHYRRHTKSLFCRHASCPQAIEGGFSSKKDRARHEAKHNPQITCEWDGCDRLFSRVDNMVCPPSFLKLCKTKMTRLTRRVEGSRQEDTPPK